MSFEKQMQIYSYTLNILSLSLTVKFPCRIYLQYGGKSVTSEVSPSSPNKFVFNQEVTLKNETEKEYIEVVLQLITQKGAKYVGGVIKFIENQLIGSQGQRLVIPIQKCLDTEAYCEVRVDQVSVSRVAKKNSPIRRNTQKSQYQPQINAQWTNPKFKVTKQAETKSQFNFPLSMVRGREKNQLRNKEAVMVGNNNIKKQLRLNESMGMEKEPTLSMMGGANMSPLEFEVYKQGYNKLKQKYRKEAENARSQMNKRIALQSNENNLKLEVMRYKLKTQQLEKAVTEKSQRVKELNEVISNLQKRQLDTKYLKEQVQNKNYLIKNLEETLKALTKDNNELKSLQNYRSQTEQEIMKGLKDEVQNTRKNLEQRETQLMKEIKAKNQALAKKDYELHAKIQEMERNKCSMEDLQKVIMSKTFEWEKIQQNDRQTAKAKLEQCIQKIAILQFQKSQIQQKSAQLQAVLQKQNTKILKMEYDDKVLQQTNQSLQKQNQELRFVRDKYIQLIRLHRLLTDQKTQFQKNKERQCRLKDTQIDDLTLKLSSFTQSSRKSVRQLQQKLKSTQMKLIQSESQNQLQKNQLQKAKRLNDICSKQLLEVKNNLKDFKLELKDKDDKLFSIANEFNDTKNKNNQGDYSNKLQITRLKQELEKVSKGWEQERLKSSELAAMLAQLELNINKAKMESQFKEEKAMKQSGYAKQKITSLQTLKSDLQHQMNSMSQSIINFKLSEKGFIQKIQKMDMQAINLKQSIQKLKKQLKLIEEKLNNSENNTKIKIKQLNEHFIIKEELHKRISQLDQQIMQLKNQLTTEKNQNNRNQKIIQMLQVDLGKGKEEHARLNGIIIEKEKLQQLLREQIKKQKEEYTKLDMKLTAVRKQYQKFKQTLVQNVNSVFGAIPQGYYNLTSSKIIKQNSNFNFDKTGKQNSQILNLLASLGKDARTNMVKIIEQLRQSIKQNQKLNSQFSTTINKSNTSEFELNQQITEMEDQISDLIGQKQADKNKYEEEIFLLEGKISQKEGLIEQLTQQVEELDFSLKNTRAEFQTFREETTKKELTKNKLIKELREQIDYHLSDISVLQVSLEKNQQSLQNAEKTLEERNQHLAKLQKQLEVANESLHLNIQQNDALKRQLKKINEALQESNLQLISQREQGSKLKESNQQQQKKATELRKFISGLMKQKEDVIKQQLQKSQLILGLQTKVSQLNHQHSSLREEYQKIKKSEEDYKELVKKQTKKIKEQENLKNQQISKVLKLTEKLKEKQKEIQSKEQTFSKFQEKVKKEKEKSSKDFKQLQSQLEQTYTKMLSKDKQNGQKILILQNQVDHLNGQIDKLNQELVICEESLFSQRNKSENLAEELAATEKQLVEANENIKSQQRKITELEDSDHSKEEQLFKLHGKMFSLQKTIDLKQQQKNDKMQNLHNDWFSKYDSMCQEYEQRLELMEKEKQFAKTKIDEKQRQIKKLTNEIKLQQNNVQILKKGFDEKIKSLEDDRLSVLSQKNTQNQRLIQQSRVNYQNLKSKESEYRRLNSDLQLVKMTASKLQSKLSQSQDKVKNLNKTYLAQNQENKKKQVAFKKLKESVVSSIWKSQRQLRKIVQTNIKKILQVVDEKNTVKVMEITKSLEQAVVSALSIKLE